MRISSIGTTYNFYNRRNPDGCRGRQNHNSIINRYAQPYNISFMADVSKLNRDVFEQRHIIQPQDSLSIFVDNVYSKITEKDPSPYTIIENPPIPTYAKNDMFTINYDYIYGDGEKVHVAVPSQIGQSDDLYRHMESLFLKGTEYQKQSLECLNKARTEIPNILKQYGINPNELYNNGCFKVKKSISQRFDELIEDPTIEKRENKNKPYRTVIVLPDKYNPDAVITLTRDNYYSNQRCPDDFLDTCEFSLFYKDPRIRYDFESAKIKADDGNALLFDYCMPRRNINSDPNNYGRIVLGKEISTLKSYGGFFDDDSPFYDIKDYKNKILYTFKNNNGTDELVSVYDLKKDILFMKNKDLKYVENREIALGTSLYTNLLQPKKPMGACVVLPYDMRKGEHAIKQEIEPHIINGVGTGFDLSETDNPVEVLTFLNETLKEYDDKTQRPPAGIAILDVNHKDIESFIKAKRDADFSDWRFNISVSVPNDFMQKVANDEDLTLTDGKEIPARQIYSELLDSMHRCGEPGIVFKDNVEASNPLPNHKYKGMASCAEIGLENGEMCLFSHINLDEFLDKKTNKIDFQAMGEAASTLSRFLDNVIDINLAEKVGEDNIAAQKRRFGIGVCGYADLLANMNIPYGSPQSQKVLADCLEVINYSSKKTSMELAKEKGCFPLFDESRYNERDFLIKHSEGSPITQAQWDELYDNVQKYGLRNATTTALPPTGSSSRIVGASYSIEPYFDLQNNKTFRNKLSDDALSITSSEYLWKKIENILSKTGSCQGIVYLKDDFKDVFRLGNEINYKDHLKIMGTAQRFVDDGISKTVNFENSATVDDIDDAVQMAYNMGLKGIAVFRDGCLSERE